jgi:hypothetical protein
MNKSRVNAKTPNPLAWPHSEVKFVLQNFCMIRDYVIPDAFRKHEWFRLGTDAGSSLSLLLAGDSATNVEFG